MAASQARTRHPASLDLMGSPTNWIWDYLAKRGKTPSWWSELQSFSPGQLSDAQVQELTKKQAVGFRLSAVQDAKVGWWNASPCLSSLQQWQFLPKTKFQGTSNIKEVRREETVALAKALQCCTQRSRAPPGITCCTVRHLQGCLAPLLQLHDEDILEDCFLESVGDEPVAFLTPAEEALLLSEKQEPWGAQASVQIIPSQSEGL